jgi:hypothetical protein
VVEVTGGPAKRVWWSVTTQPPMEFVHVCPRSSEKDRTEQLGEMRSSAKMRSVAGSR